MRWVWVVLLAVVTGCSAAADPAWPTGPDDLVLRVVDAPGMPSFGWEFELPAVSLYGDGLLVLADKPGKTVVQRRLTVDGMRRLVRSAVNAGLAKKQDYGSPRISDGGASIFTLVTSERIENSIAAAFELSGDNPAQSEARRRVHTFRKGLNDLDSWLGDDIGPATTPGPAANIVFSYRTNVDTLAAAWPYDDLMTAGQQYSAGRCQILPAERVRALGQSKIWRSGDNVFAVTMRPVLPDQKSCADIKRNQ